MTAQGATTTDAIDPKTLLKVLSDYKGGNFSARLPVDRIGTTGKIYNTLNEVIELNQRMAKEIARISRVVGKGGNIKQRASLQAAGGAWQQCIESVNTLVTDLVQPTTEVARVIGAAGAEVRRTEALLKTGALQHAIFNSANFSSIATDEKGVIQIFNVGAERMLGYTAADVVNTITPRCRWKASARRRADPSGR